MSLDRDLQRQILEELADEYPNYVDFYLRVSESENWKYSEAILRTFFERQGLTKKATTCLNGSA